MQVPPGFQYNLAQRLIDAQKVAPEPIPTENENLHDTTTLLQIFKEMSSKLRACKTKADQIAVLGELIITYG